MAMSEGKGVSSERDLLAYFSLISYKSIFGRLLTSNLIALARSGPQGQAYPQGSLEIEESGVL